MQRLPRKYRCNDNSCKNQLIIILEVSNFDLAEMISIAVSEPESGLWSGRTRSPLLLTRSSQKISTLWNDKSVIFVWFSLLLCVVIRKWQSDSSHTELFVEARMLTRVNVPQDQLELIFALRDIILIIRTFIYIAAVEMIAIFLRF